MTEIPNPKQYDLEDRTLEFAKNVITFTKVLPRTVANRELVKQLVRSCGSVGANYIEANESLSKKDADKDLPKRGEIKRLLAETR